MRWFADAAQDVRYAIRTLRKSPGFTVVAVLTLALGIGATTAIYSVVDAVLLQPLPFVESDRLVRVFENIASIFPGRAAQRGVTYPEFLDWRQRSQTLVETMAVVPLGQRTVRTADGSARLWGGMTSANAFTVLGSHAFLGRTLGPDDDSHPDVIVISFETWRRFFHGEPQAIGTSIELRAPESAGRLLTVVGVMPEGFEFPTGELDFYTPIVLDPTARQPPSVAFLARLKAGVSLDAARDEANLIGSAIRPPRPANAPALNVPRFDVQRLKDRVVQGMQPVLAVLLGAVGVVLLIVCANVANLLLARGSARQRELAVRRAVGASRGRIARQLLTECLVLATAGGVLGAALGAAGVTLVKRLAIVDSPGIFRLVFGASILPRGSEIGVDLRMFGIAFGIAAVTTLAFGLLPALQLSRATPPQGLGARRSTSGRVESRTRAGLAVAQLTLATVLLVGAGLLIRSFVTLTAVQVGFDPSRVLAFQLVFPAEYSIARKAETIGALLERLRTIPAVTSAGFSRAGILITEEIVVGTFVPQGRTVSEMRAEAVRPRVRSVSAGYLTTLGVKLLEGRDFEATDSATAPPVVVINKTVARRFFGEISPVGQFVSWHPNKGEPVQVQVVGVADDIRNTTPDRDPFPEVFVDYRQLLTVQQRWGDSTRGQDEISIGLLSFAVKTATDPALATLDVSRTVRAVDPNIGIESIVPMTRLVTSSLARQRFYVVILGVFAAIAAALAAIGIYGVLAYAVTQRTQEIGIRMALGAQRSQVIGLVMRTGVTVTVIGIALGLAGAAAATRWLQGMLFGVTPLDPVTFTVVSLAFAAVAALASSIPARRATAVDPLIALRSE